MADLQYDTQAQHGMFFIYTYRLLHPFAVLEERNEDSSWTITKPEVGVTTLVATFQISNLSM